MNDRAATVLVIEDEPALRESMADYLEDREFRVFTAENGRMGLEVFERERPDLVLTDLRMPDVDGLEVLRRVGELSPETALIVVSGTGRISDSVRALQLGAWDYILKPIDDMSIISLAVEKALERARLLRENRDYQQNLETLVRQRTAELQQANARLASTVAELERSRTEREELIARLEAQNAELERFAYTVSHDLKTPLITVKGYIGALSEDLARSDMTLVADDLARISGAADKMAVLLRDVLELSRIGRVVNPSENVPLRELAEEALELFLKPIQKNNIRVEVSPDLPVVYGDRTRLLEVLQNLIENAIKYMGDPPRPRIQIGSRLDGRDRVFYVRDNGIGIDSRYHDRIFNLFDQLDGSVEGTGIGLALAKRIVDIHGGRIWVESEGAGRGSTFCFTIPAKSEPAESVPRDPVASEP
ncbi:MAG: response regulator [Planctomycetaceae bacterium]|nr:response regulator [Planctomycetaceae bacterium]